MTRDNEMRLLLFLLAAAVALTAIVVAAAFAQAATVEDARHYCRSGFDAWWVGRQKYCMSWGGGWF